LQSLKKGDAALKKQLKNKTKHKQQSTASTCMSQQKEVKEMPWNKGSPEHSLWMR